MIQLAARQFLIDDFLTEDSVDMMLEQMLAAKAQFVPSTMTGDGKPNLDNDYRSSLRLPGRVGVDLDGLRKTIHNRFDDICAETGIEPFAIDHTECSIVAHGDGDFYKRHVDTGKPERGHVRVISCVYYLHRFPKNFDGGELAIHPLTGGAEPDLIEPVHNRLAVFPSFVPHEVLPTRSTGEFADSRFSVNVWLHKAVVQKEGKS